MEKKRDILVEMITARYEEQKKVFALMAGEAPPAPGAADDWSPKDTMAHVAHWDSVTAADLANPEDVKQDQSGGDFDQMNARIWERYSEATWEEIEALVDQTHISMVNSLRSLSEEQLKDPEFFEWLNGRPLWRGVAFTNYYHGLAHIAVLYAGEGDVEYANEIQERVAEQQKRLSEDNDWRGTAQYNLGCHYAMTGQRDKALENIKKGIDLYPTLATWAPDDPDLASLRDDPDFKTLLKD